MRRLIAYSSLCITLVTASALAWGQAVNSKKGSDKPAANNAPATPPADSATEKPARSAKVERPGKAAKELPGFTAEREAAALLFVRTHHPELADLLEQLKVAHKSQYQQAIRDLFRTSEKLAQTQERNPRRYELDLQSWKLQSRIQVLSARLAMGPNPAIEAELRAALLEQQKVQTDQLVEERERLANRLKDLDSQLETLRTEQSQRVDARLEDMLKGIRKSSLKFKKGDGKGGDQGQKAPDTAPASTVVQAK